MFKRGKNLPGLGFSGPQATNTYNFTEKTIERLDARNAWVYCVTVFYPDLPAVLRPERCEVFYFTRFRRNLVLTLDKADGKWMLDAVVEKKSQDPEGGAPNAPPDDQGPMGGNDEGGQAGRAAQPQRDRPDDTDRDGSHPRTARASRKRKPRGDAERILGTLRDILPATGFRHIASAIAERLAIMRDRLQVERKLRELVIRLSVLALRAFNRIEAEFSSVAELFYPALDRADPIAALRTRTIQAAPGLTLVLYTFAETPNWESFLFGRLAEQPNWECWLFGRPIEEEQLVA